MTDNRSPLVVTQHGPTRILTLNRPHRRNALNDTLVEALGGALSDAETDRDTRAVVLRGAGKSFCAGADLQYFLHLHARGQTPLGFLRKVSALATRLEASRLPVVAAIHGHAVAGGLELALACDVVIATPTARIGDGHVRNNLLPAGGASVRLPRKVGDSMARWLALTGALLPATELSHTGWLHAVVDHEHLHTTALAAATELAEHAGPAQHAYKTLLADLTGLDEKRGLAHELDAFDAHWQTSDVPAALNDFLHGRTTTTNSHPAPTGTR
ncbi:MULTISPECIES: enoyl-CoA hydratase/isomerase family protein [unclassified Rhodococcus (in: high G+C Gram-positive bacteria)]|uniref:enoyl-CoA hydratase/isomerase family protein n=1 Tax=unclassified Rhodococcus (in: high G+C Gram-positive bacteria) TaxID=192944 RepID=UPI00163B00EA|nr:MULTISPECIES: enoyl-CoA hydratase/isomerase family protein [unclassified Rhodococcus (in: high G+C Gram-positive bacteria)]MBC2644598.1 enoyl-CoA hydratase/isomerase family protein [Rhodococcus sp. 3A]MBC2890958.1 enoyl-CoA hydratase/isomerase family protein [Rhodococcus sp. 4CII]MBC2897697.1 enoyl-CoA hydratase/isomerase family protein [Rhodococcus sp. 4CII]